MIENVCDDIHVEGIPKTLVSVCLGDPLGVPVGQPLEAFAFHGCQLADCVFYLVQPRLGS
jgi:hypothetical protein